MKKKPQQNTTDTIKGFTYAIAVNPTNPDNYAARGTRFFDIEEYARAIVDLEEALALKSTHAPFCHACLGASYLALNCYAKAIEHFEIAEIGLKDNEKEKNLVIKIKEDLNTAKKELEKKKPISSRTYPKSFQETSSTSTASTKSTRENENAFHP